MNKNDIEFFRYVFGRIGKYVAITICTILLVSLLIGIFSSLFVRFENIGACLIISIVVANCTGLLFGKLHQIQQQLENRTDNMSTDIAPKE